MLSNDNDYHFMIMSNVAFVSRDISNELVKKYLGNIYSREALDQSCQLECDFVGELWLYNLNKYACLADKCPERFSRT